MGRVLTDAGAPLEALKHFDAAAKLPLADELPLVYRIGIAQQAAGQKDAARESFKRYVAAGKGSKGNLEDAKKRLAELGG
jgi:Tfp pilus assembly protein PilF